MEFRLLRADEIECRISTCNKYGVQLLLYKDARCDMNILDETVGIERWQRSHDLINGNLFCNVGINFPNEDGYDCWVWKQDVGTESYTEKEKGEASDSFKRACFNWGIGRELYTAPQMFVRAKDLETLVESGKDRYTCKDYFKVKEIEYINKRICYVKIVNLKNNKEIEFGTPAEEQNKQETIAKSFISEVKAKALLERCKNDLVPAERICTLYKVKSFAELTEKQYRNIADNWSKIGAMQ